MKTTHETSLTIHGVTAEQFAAIQKLLSGKAATTDTDGEETDAVDMTALKKKAVKKTKPQTTVSDEEDEDFGTKAMTKKDLATTDDEDEDTDTDEDDTDTDEDEDESTLTFDEVKAALNKYGNKKPDEARAILLGFNMKSTKELQNHPKKWEAVYRKVMAKMKKK